MTSKELLRRIDEKDYLTEREHREFLSVLNKDLKRLEAIDNANPSEALKSLEELRDFRYGEDKLLVCQTEMYSIIKQALLKAQDNEELKIDICEMFGLDNLFPYNDTEEIIKELEEYMDRKNQLWVDFMKTSKQLKKQDKILDAFKNYIKISSDGIISCHDFILIPLFVSKEYEKQYNLLKEWLDEKD